MANGPTEYDLVSQKLQSIQDLGALLLDVISKKAPLPETWVDGNGVTQKMGTFVEDKPGQLDKAVLDLKFKILQVVQQL